MPAPSVVEMQPGPLEDGVCTYTGRFSTNAPGLYGFTVRVLPSNADLSDHMDLGVVRWA